MIDAIISDDKNKKEDGQKILQVKYSDNVLLTGFQAFKKQLIFKKQQDKISKGENPNGKI